MKGRVHLTALLLSAFALACGRETPLPSGEEAGILAAYLAASEAYAEVAASHPRDRVAAGEALAALHAEHVEEHLEAVRRVRALYTEDLRRPEGQRLSDRHPGLMARLEAASRRLSVHVTGEPWLLRDERAREVLAAVAVSDAAAFFILTRWEEVGPPHAP